MEVEAPYHSQVDAHRVSRAWPVHRDCNELKCPVARLQNTCG